MKPDLIKVRGLNDDFIDASKTSQTLSKPSLMLPENLKDSPSSTSSSTSIKLPTSVNRFKQSPSTLKSNHKSSVSILPVNSADIQVPPMSSVKKQSGIEIIPLDDIGQDSSLDPSSKPGCKDIRRSLSEDDKRKFDRKDGSSSKKRKHEFDRASMGHKKSPTSKRPLFDEKSKSSKPSASSFHSDKNRNHNDDASKVPLYLPEMVYAAEVKREPKPEVKKETSPSSSVKSLNKIKFTAISDSSGGGGGISSSTSILEITPTTKSSSDQKSSSSKERKGSESPSLKLTIKNSSSGGSSSSKHKSDHYHKSSSGKSSSSSKVSSSSGSSKPRSSSSGLPPKYQAHKSRYVKLALYGPFELEVS